ncbi:hypothetical protein IFM12276_33540 [Nocardia sputorum]|uniref:Uncharacterized protein n=1 Tax=Nocardia sputorum TaxID=2984338 RepID=A0ABM8CZ66_9NOCA|nr:hypothetical protein IFM12276_33540 [Nocardia sputorum]
MTGGFFNHYDDPDEFWDDEPIRPDRPSRRILNARAESLNPDQRYDDRTVCADRLASVAKLGGDPRRTVGAAGGGVHVQGLHRQIRASLLEWGGTVAALRFTNA